LDPSAGKVRLGHAFEVATTNGAIATEYKRPLVGESTNERGKVNVIACKRASHGEAGSLWRVSAGLLALGIAFAALGVGAIHTLVLAAVVVVLAGAAATAWWSPGPTRLGTKETILLVVAAGLGIYTALQCLPLPTAWLSRIAPYNAAVWARSLSPLREPGPAWAPVSLDPTSSRVELLKALAYMCALLAALGVTRHHGGASFLGNTIIAVGVAVAILAYAHPSLGLHKLYGFYDPGPGIAERHIAPLMNPNNLGGYLNLALCLALARVLSPDRRHRSWFALVFVGLVGAEVWVASRGAVVTMVAGSLIVLGLSSPKHFGRVAGVVPSFIALVAVVGAVLVVLGGSEDASNELFVADVSKLGMFGRVMVMLPKVAWFGCGRGAFESAYPAFRSDTGHVTYTHPENVVAQWIIEWGAPVGITAFAALAYALRSRTSCSHRVYARGAWAGLVALGVQNLADLGSEVPAVALAGVVCAAIVVGGGIGRRDRSEMTGRTFPLRAVALGCAGLGAIVAFCAARSASGELNADRRALRLAALEWHLSPGKVHDLARAAMLRHPAEPYLPYVTALRASRERDDDGLPWIEATIERAPVYAPAHLVLARLLAGRSPSQARLEYRLTMEHEIGLVGTVMAEAPRLIGDFDDAIELVPQGRAENGVLEALSASIRSRLPATATRLDRILALRGSQGSELRIAEDAVRDIESGSLAPWCRDAEAKPRCIARAMEVSQRVLSLAPNRCGGHSLLARALVASGSVDRALTDLAHAAQTVDDRVECLEALVAIARSAGEPARAERALDEIARSACVGAGSCGETLRWASGQEEAAGHLERAFALCRRGREREPDNLELLACNARLAARAGLHAEAAQHYRELVRRQPERQDWIAAEISEKAAAMKGVVERP